MPPLYETFWRRKFLAKHHCLTCRRITYSLAGQRKCRACRTPFRIKKSKKSVFSRQEFFGDSKLQFNLEGRPQEQIDCCICLQPIDTNSYLNEKLDCCHTFHKQCIEMWLKRANSCPLCRKQVPGVSPPESPQIETISISIEVSQSGAIELLIETQLLRE